MHATERERMILEAVARSGFISYRDLEASLSASPATIRRDLSRLEAEGRLLRVHGGAKLVADAGEDRLPNRLAGTPFDTAITQNLAAKRAIGKAAARLCLPGEGVAIDGGTTTFQMCEYLAGLGLQVLTNSLHIVNALLGQSETRILVPSGTVFREQAIILAPSGESSMPEFHAAKLFIGAAAVSPHGILQADSVLVTSQRRLLECADQAILLVDSSKLDFSSGAIVCPLDRINLLITDKGADLAQLARLKEAGLREYLIVD